MRAGIGLVVSLVMLLLNQGLVAFVPHRHGPAGNAASTPAAPDAVVAPVDGVQPGHRCLACSVDAPAVRPVPRQGTAADGEGAIATPGDPVTPAAASRRWATEARGPPGFVRL